MASEFKVGDLVWGKIETYPWWPGQIYDEALADCSVLQMKNVGCFLVSFFGDDTCGWIDPKNLLPFESHFLSKSKQSKSEAFEKAVDEVTDEVHAREKFAFSCQCRKSSGGYEGATYPEDQVERFRSELKPAEMVSFVHELALEPMDLTRDGRFIRLVGSVLGYRKVVFAEHDSTYGEAHATPDLWTDEDSSDREEAPQAITAKLLPPSQNGSSTTHSQTNKALGKRDRAKFEKTIDNQKSPKIDSGDHVSRNRSKYRKCYQDAFVDKEALVLNTSKSSSSIVPFEKGMGKSVRDPHKSRIMEIESASMEGAKATIMDTQALVCKPSKPSTESRIEEDKLASSPKGAILRIKFPPLAPLPSTSELKAKFARFGKLDIPATYSNWNSSICRVGFKRISDAESACDYLQRHGNMYSNTKISFFLEAPEVTPTPKSSESAKLLGNSSTNPPNHWSSSSSESTLLSSEVKGQESPTEKYQKTIPSSVLPPVPVYSEVSSRINNEHMETSQNAITTTTTETNSIDISRPLLELLEKAKYLVDLNCIQK